MNLSLFFLSVLLTVHVFMDVGARHKPPGPRDFCSGDYVKVHVVDDSVVTDDRDILIASSKKIIIFESYVHVTTLYMYVC